LCENPVLQGLFHKREWFGAGSGAGSGSAPLTNGSWSGSWRPKNMRFLRIRISNTGSKEYNLSTSIYYASQRWFFAVPHMIVQCSVHSLPFQEENKLHSRESPHQWAVFPSWSTISPQSGTKNLATDWNKWWRGFRPGLLFLITEGQRLWKGQLGKNNRVNLLHLKSASRDFYKKDKNNKCVLIGEQKLKKCLFVVCRECDEESAGGGRPFAW
jgi:hypothetical protein